MNVEPRWTEAEKQSVRELVQIDTPPHVVARMHDRTMRSVRAKLPRGRVPRVLRRDIYDAVIAEAQRQDMTPVQLVRVLVSCIAVDNLWNGVLDLGR